ncbi:sporulation protein YjcZ [Bacillus songklensis]|uniref:Sporulation protein YjcZ n=1 Tax=Bacillus songklensis TaxID=1069116 RepID=A0ABV8B187_9BACI
MYPYGYPAYGPYGGGGYSRGYGVWIAVIIVLFILLVIFGAFYCYRNYFC